MARRRIDGPIRYVIASHSWLDGVKLSRRGEWANLPFSDEAMAEAAARSDAKGQPFQIERLRVSR